ncbi:VWA domain-containing protein [Sedimentimonas flavescens]|uniref:VWA domain-containing protein n=1 Tax=Sedimentimonas flavescens TaxID=2851012 RepID=A0ABT2ZV46_9RHOB|nr:vWA domain-containing protein [Sedimentimonas flavescens]MCV2877619.1 VWA domain-containing protein [Sedimentimonas flavescens]
MGKSSTQTIGYKYHLGLHGVLCQAPIDKILAFKWQDKIAWEGAAIDKQIYINKPELFGGKKKEGGVQGYVDLLGGGEAQGENDYLKAKFAAGGVIPAFRGAVSFVLRQCYIGNNPFLKPISVKARNVFSTFAGWYPEKAPINPYVKLDGAMIYIAMDSSGSMAGAQLLNQFAAVKGFIQSLKGTTNSLCVVTYASGIGNSKIIYNCSDADYDAFCDWIDALPGAFGGTNFAAAVSMAADFFSGAAEEADTLSFITDSLTTLFPSLFGNAGESPIIRQRIVLLLSDGAGLDATVARSTLDAIGNVETYCIGIDAADIVTLGIVDNTPDDGVPIVSGGDPDGIRAAIAASAAGWLDINPAHILRDLVVSQTSGGTGDSGEIGASFAAAADQLYAEGFGLSIFHANPSSRDEFKAEIERHIDGACNFDRATGKWELKLIRDDYDAETLFEFDGATIMEWIECETPEQVELPNQITVVYTNREDGETSSLTVTNVAAVQMVGRIIPDKVEYMGINWPDLAARVAARDLVAMTTPLAKGSFRATYAPQDLNVGSAIKIHEPRLGLEHIIARITEIEDGDGRDNSVIINFVEDKFSIDDTALIGQDEFAQEVPPRVPNIRFVEEEPYYLRVLSDGQSVVDQALTDNPDLGAFIATADLPSAGWHNIAIGKLDGATWREVGQADFAPASWLTADLTSSAEDTEIQVQLNDSLGQVVVGSLCRVGQEYMRVDSAAVSGQIMTLTVGRGCLDTVPARHPTGAGVIFWQAVTGSDGTDYLAGESISIKLQPQSFSAQVGISETATDVLAFGSRAIRPYPVGRLKLNATYLPTGLLDDGDTLTWVHRDRTFQTTLAIEDHDAASIGPETGVSYTVEVRAVIGRDDFFALTDVFAQDDWFLGDSVLIREEAVGTATTWTYSDAAPNLFARADFFGVPEFFGVIGGRALRAEFGVRVERDGYENWQTPVVRVGVLAAPANLVAETY